MEESRKGQGSLFKISTELTCFPRHALSVAQYRVPPQVRCPVVTQSPAGLAQRRVWQQLPLPLPSPTTLPLTPGPGSGRPPAARTTRSDTLALGRQSHREGVRGGEVAVSAAPPRSPVWARAGLGWGGALLRREPRVPGSRPPRQGLFNNRRVIYGLAGGRRRGS